MVIKYQKQNKFFCEDENIQFNFLETKIKIRYIHRDKKTYLTLKKWVNEIMWFLRT